MQNPRLQGECLCFAFWATNSTTSHLFPVPKCFVHFMLNKNAEYGFRRSINDLAALAAFDRVFSGPTLCGNEKQGRIIEAVCGTLLCVFDQLMSLNMEEERPIIEVHYSWGINFFHGGFGTISLWQKYFQSPVRLYLEFQQYLWGVVSFFNIKVRKWNVSASRYTNEMYPFCAFMCYLLFTFTHRRRFHYSHSCCLPAA